MSLAWLFVDFNSYFASVEQHLNPRLRGKPVAVVPMNVDSTCAIAASYEAKKFGVKTGTRVSDAKRMCPGLRIIEARHEAYVEWHHALLRAIDSCIEVRKENVMSIDEVACELTGRLRERAAALELARRIKTVIARDVGECLRSSIGISTNVFLAKTASDMQKPDGLMVIEKDELPSVLHGLALRDLCGIGWNMEDRLHAIGIHTVEQLCAAPKHTLHAAWRGIEGERMFELLRGNSVPRPSAQHSSLGHSHVLPPEERHEAGARAVLHRLLQKAAMRLRHNGWLAGGLTLSLKYPRGSRWGDELVFRETSDTMEFIHALQTLWERRPQGLAPLAVGVTLSHLTTAENVTPALFPESRPREKLDRALDALNKRYGKQAVYFAGAHTALKSAPMRIAFNRIPDLETEGD
ncbi:MAG: hypothetical protein K8R23_09605 [Chthoniobacter sp.]|nr:hypothetical protein [Chthoniobacter sp.]